MGIRERQKKREKINKEKDAWKSRDIIEEKNKKR